MRLPRGRRHTRRAPCDLHPRLVRLWRADRAGRRARVTRA